MGVHLSQGSENNNPRPGPAQWLCLYGPQANNGSYMLSDLKRQKDGVL